MQKIAEIEHQDKSGEAARALHASAQHAVIKAKNMSGAGRQKQMKSIILIGTADPYRLRISKKQD